MFHPALPAADPHQFILFFNFAGEGRSVLPGLLTVLHGGSNGAKLLALEVIALLTNHAKLLSECIRRGAVVYLLEVVGR